MRFHSAAAHLATLALATTPACVECLTALNVRPVLASDSLPTVVIEGEGRETGGGMEGEKGGGGADRGMPSDTLISGTCVGMDCCRTRASSERSMSRRRRI
jgi:hypothetical protein